MTSSKRVILKIGGDEVDITEFPPVTMGDAKRLRQQGIDFTKLNEMVPDDESKLILLLVQKVRPATTLEEVDALPIKVGQDILRHAVNRSAEIDSPLSPSSTPLAGTTGGAAAS